MWARNIKGLQRRGCDRVEPLNEEAGSETSGRSGLEGSRAHGVLRVRGGYVKVAARDDEYGGVLAWRAVLQAGGRAGEGLQSQPSSPCRATSPTSRAFHSTTCQRSLACMTTPISPSPRTRPTPCLAPSSNYNPNPPLQAARAGRRSVAAGKGPTQCRASLLSTILPAPLNEGTPTRANGGHP